MFLLAIIFLSLVFIFVKSLDHLSNEFLQLPTIPEVTPTPSVIDQCGGDTVECQGDSPPGTEHRDGSSLKKTQVSDCQVRIRSDSDQEFIRLDSEGNDKAELFNEECNSDILGSSDHASNDQYCTESVSDIEYSELEESVNDGDDLPVDTSSTLSETVHGAERQDFRRTVLNLESLTSDESTNDASLNNKCFNDILSSSDENSTGLSALESLRRMQVICGEMREALMSARYGSDRCSDTCNVYKDKNCDKESIESLASKSSVDTDTHNRQTYIHETDSGVYREVDKIDSLHDLQQQHPQNGKEDEGSNELKTTDSHSTEDEKRVMETEQTIQTFDPTDDFDVMEQSLNTTRDNDTGIIDDKFKMFEKLEDTSKNENYSTIPLESTSRDNDTSVIDNNVEIFENFKNASEHKTDSKIGFESTNGNNDEGFTNKKNESLERLKDGSEHENEPYKEFKSDENLQLTNEIERLNAETDEKSEIVAQNSDKLVGEVGNGTNPISVDNFWCTADCEVFLSNGSPIDTSGCVRLQSPSTISMYEMDEFLFWERLKDVIARCHKNGQKYSQNISDYYSSTKGTYEDFDRRTDVSNMETQLSLFNKKIEAKKGGRNRIEFGPEMSQYLLDTNSFPRHIFEQESMNLSLGPLVVFFGKEDGTATSRQVGDAMDEEANNKRPVISDEKISPAVEKHSKAMSLDTLQSDQRNNYKFSGTSIGSEVCGRLICYDSSFHSIDSTITPEDKGDKNKRKFGKYYSVYKKFENSEH
ncbi:hypothetical protein LSTR_LSTR002489 [Laodelphax striatellus]|uniref:Uncharacterized protein n=1 Tax=Laodelphax striatellus TaxID=195883 RepID=A0A482X398_LAOST|nr:hypothetical protein LSTR_LSTR002489 [Laodelphax striatellus]